MAHLRAGATFETYREAASCRFACGPAGRNLGRRDLTDGRFVWPEGLAHYVLVHSTRLPEAFVEHVRAEAGPRDRRPRAPRARAGMIDDAPWLAWGRAQGAALDLTGWAPLTWADQRKVLAELARLLGPRHVLAGEELEILLGRPRTRELLCLRARGALAIVTLASGAPTTLLAGWDAWPRAAQNTNG